MDVELERGARKAGSWLDSRASFLFSRGGAFGERGFVPDVIVSTLTRNLGPRSLLLCASITFDSGSILKYTFTKKAVRGYQIGIHRRSRR